MYNPIKHKIASGEQVLGTFFKLGNPYAVECASLAGLDFVVLDCEHGAYEAENTVAAMMVAGRYGITPFVRVRDTGRSAVMKMLDAGAHGLIIPYVKTVEEVEKLIEFSKYYPIGSRGYAGTISNGFNQPDWTKNTLEYFETCNRETLLIPQCETKECLDNIEAIAALEGVDGILFGPADLSVSLGIPGNMQAPMLLEAMEHVKSVCKRNGKIAMINCGSADKAKAFFAKGFDGVTCSSDANALIAFFQKLVQEAKSK